MRITSETVFPIPEGPIDNPGNWRGSDFLENDDWVTQWTEQALRELTVAVATVKQSGKKPPRFGKEDFPLPTIADELQAILDDLETGNGFAVIRGILPDAFDEDEAEILFWGLMVHLGYPLSQNAMGNVLGHVRDMGLDIKDTKVRNYQTTAELFFHNDSCDVLMLMCRRTAKQGGRSRLASIPALFNAMWAEDPALTRELFEPFAFDRRGEPGRPDEGDDPFYALPILNYHDGYLTARMVPRSYIHSAQRFKSAPRLTDRMNRALDFMEEIVVRPDVSFDFDMAPGDIQLINNYCTFHSRTEFVDHDAPEKKRHMLRAWLSVPNSRPLPPWYIERWGSVTPGDHRGGIYASIQDV